MTSCAQKYQAEETADTSWAFLKPHQGLEGKHNPAGGSRTNCSMSRENGCTLKPLHCISRKEHASHPGSIYSHSHPHEPWRYLSKHSRQPLPWLLTSAERPVSMSFPLSSSRFSSGSTFSSVFQSISPSTFKKQKKVPSALTEVRYTWETMAWEVLVLWRHAQIHLYPAWPGSSGQSRPLPRKNPILSPGSAIAKKIILSSEDTDGLQRNLRGVFCPSLAFFFSFPML